MAWTYWMCDTVTGTRLLQVVPSAGSWGRVLNAFRGGSHEFKTAAVSSPVTPWASITVPWATTLVQCWNGRPVYAGIVTGRNEAWDDGRTFTITHSEFRIIFARRFPFAVGAFAGGTFSANNLQYRSILATLLQYTTVVGGTQILPVVLPAIVAGTQSRTYYNYSLQSIEDGLREIQNSNGGPDIDFAPSWSGGLSGGLQYTARMGTDAAPKLTGGIFDFNMTAERNGLFNVSITEDATKQLTGIIAVGAGSGADVKVAQAGIGAAGTFGTVPRLDVAHPFGQIEVQTDLQNHANAEIALYQYPTKQWQMSLMADGPVDVGSLVLGSTLRVYNKGRILAPDGWTSQRLIGISGDLSNKITLDVQAA